jgi:DNA-binding SARP family transcriptional activator
MVTDRGLAHADQWNLRLIDGFAFEGANDQVLAIANRKARGILAYLALARNASESRERIAGLLWSDRAEDQARASLRQCLKQLRDQCGKAGFEGLRAERQDIGLDTSRVVLDLNIISDELEQGRVSDLLTDGHSVSERILYGYEALDASFDSWLHVIRQNWHDRVIDGLQTIMRNAAGDGSETTRAADALVRMDPTHEEAHRCLIRHYADSGNTPAALKQYKLLWDHLDEEFDMEPDDETMELIGEIKAGTYEPPGRAVVATAAKSAVSPVATARLTLPVIGIRNFVQAGPWRRERFLIDGFRRELVAALIRFREWIIVEQGQPQGAFSSSDEAGSAMATDYIVEGSYLEEGDSVHVVATLKDARQGRYVWSERLDLTEETWFEAHRLIVRRVAISLNIYLSVDRMQRATTRFNVPSDVYSRWLLGQELSYRWRLEDEEQAEEIFRSIIDETPRYAPAYSSLAQIINSRHHIYPGTFRSPEQHVEALELAKEAVKNDPLDSRTQLSLAWALAMNALYDKAILNYRLAGQLNENDPWTLVSSALGLAYCGESEEALDLTNQALAVGLDSSPLHLAYRSGVYFICGDYEACVDAASNSDDAVGYVQAWKSAALAHLDRLDEAREQARGFMESTRKIWRGGDDPSDAEIARWLLQCFPIRDRSTWKRLRDGLTLAGVPIE